VPDDRRQRTLRIYSWSQKFRPIFRVSPLHLSRRVPTQILVRLWTAITLREMTLNPIKRHWSPHKRGKIVALLSAGLSGKAVAAQFNISRDAVYSLNKRYKHQINGRSNLRSGRPPLLDERHKRHIFRVIRQNPFISNHNLLKQASLPCSFSTLSRWLKSQGIQHFKAIRRPKLTPELAKKRLTFTRQHLEKPLP
jgi:transposase